MNYKELVKKTVKIRVYFRPKNSKKVKMYYGGSKRRLLSRLRACSSGRFKILTIYAGEGNFKNESAWYSTKQEAINAMNAFTTRSLLKEFLPK